MLRARVETVLAALFAIAAVGTAISPTWIETLTGLEPDAGSGETEWWAVALLAAMALTAALLARRDYRASMSRTGLEPH
jgi:hypothetical protein